MAVLSGALMYMFLPTPTVPPRILEISFQEFRQGPLKQRKVCVSERDAGKGRSAVTNTTLESASEYSYDVYMYLAAKANTERLEIIAAIIN